MSALVKNVRLESTAEPNQTKEEESSGVSPNSQPSPTFSNRTRQMRKRKQHEDDGNGEYSVKSKKRRSRDNATEETKTTSFGRPSEKEYNLGSISSTATDAVASDVANVKRKNKKNSTRRLVYKKVPPLETVGHETKTIASSDFFGVKKMVNALMSLADPTALKKKKKKTKRNTNFVWLNTLKLKENEKVSEDDENQRTKTAQDMTDQRKETLNDETTIIKEEKATAGI